MTDSATATPQAPAVGFDELSADPDVRMRLRQVIDDVFGSSLCLRCLGRILSRAARDRPAEAKGRQLADAFGANPVAEAHCRWCEGLFAEREKFAAIIEQAAAPYGYTSFLLGSRLHPDITDLETRVQATLGEPLKEHFEPLRTELNREIGALVAPRTGKRVDFARPDITITLDPQFDQASVTASSVYLYGRYRKYDREIPQTKWPCRACRGGGCKQCQGTGQQYPSSVEALIAEQAIPLFGARDESFHGSGREDIDALMLGTGRPFVLELKEPRVRTPRDVPAGAPVGVDSPEMDMAELERRINAHARPRVEVEGLRYSDKDEVVHIKEAAFDKAYRAHVVAEAPVSRHALHEAIGHILASPIEQRTPERVAHRRADKVRPRRVKTVAVTAWGHHVRAEHEADPVATPTDAGTDAAIHFTLDILAEAGTYIKELVHGDEGRTQPSFAGLLGIPMKVAYLDVVGVGAEPGAAGAPQERPPQAL